VEGFEGEEAAVIARAGERGRVTIFTQMAGRDTDIRRREPTVLTMTALPRSW